MLLLARLNHPLSSWHIRQLGRTGGGKAERRGIHSLIKNVRHGVLSCVNITSMVVVSSVTPVIVFTSRWRRSRRRGLGEQSSNEDRGLAEVDGEVRGVAKEAHHPRSRSLPLAPLAPLDRRSRAAPAQVVGMSILYLTATSSWQSVQHLLQVPGALLVSSTMKLHTE